MIRRWRNQWADKPRTADYGMQVLSRVLSHAVDPLGKIAGNPCEGIKQLYSGDRREIIWTDSDIAQLKKTCSAEIAHAVDLAATPGCASATSCGLSWSHVGEDAIVITTGKSKHRREAIIPLYDELTGRAGEYPEALDHDPDQQPAASMDSGRLRQLRSTRRRSTPGIADRDLHFHDLRGTAATKFYIAGLSERVIAEIMGWEEEYVAKIIRRYVGRSAATKAIIAQLNGQRRT